VYVDAKTEFPLFWLKALGLKPALYESEARVCSTQFLELSVKRLAIFIFVLVVVHVLIISSWKQ
jgi:hypothetical protein